MLTLCTKNEHPEKQWWWLSKLESLVVKIRDNKMDELNSQDIVGSLAENIKQIFYEVYKVAYEWELRHIITFDPAGYNET